MKEYYFTITNLTCKACSQVCMMILKKIDGVISAEVAESGTTKVVAAKPLDIDIVRNSLGAKGYTAVIV
jgi:copper chaperone CopZ